MKYKSISLELDKLLVSEPEEKDSSWIVEGYASTYDIDTGNDLIAKGAFTKTLNDRFYNVKKSKIKVLWQHNPELIIGKFLDIREEENGLYVKIELFNDPSIPEAARAYALLKHGQIDSFSIGYKEKEAVPYEFAEGKAVNLIKELTLYEVSLVTFPMNEKAEVTEVKKENMEMEKEILELLLEVKASLDLVLKENKTEETVLEVKACDDDMKEEDKKEEKASCDMDEDEDDEMKKDKAGNKCPKCGKEMTEEKGSPDPVLDTIQAEDMEDNHKTENLELVNKYFDVEVLKSEIIAEVSKIFETKLEELKSLEIKSEEKEISEKSELSLEDFMDQLLNTDIIL